MKTLIKLFSVLLALTFLAACGPQMQFIKKDQDGKIIEKNEVKANFFTDPVDMEALRRGEQGHAVAELGNSITGLYGIIIQNYKNAQNPDSTNQIRVVDDKLITLALTSMEVYGRLFAQPDDDKIHKRIETRSSSIVSSMKTTSAGNRNNYTPTGFSYEKGAYFWDKYDPHHRHRLSLSDVKILYSNPQGTYATGLKKILNVKYGK